jgi:hypothetical protein
MLDDNRGLQKLHRPVPQIRTMLDNQLAGRPWSRSYIFLIARKAGSHNVCGRQVRIVYTIAGASVYSHGGRVV